MNDLMIDNNTDLRRDGAGPSQASRGFRRTLPLIGFSLAAAIMTGCGGGGGGGSDAPPVAGFQNATPRYATASGGTYAAALEGSQNADLPMYQQTFGGASADSNFQVRSSNGTINIETPNATYSWSGAQIDRGNGVLTASTISGDRTNSIESRYLDYTQFGVWESKQYNDALELANHRGGAFHQGFETNPDNMPGTGSASYSGDMVGIASKDGVTYDIGGEVNMTANFGTNRIMGSIDTDNTFNDITLAETNISGNKFTGAASLESSGAASALSDGATGSYRGAFYGPSADEVGGSFLIQDGSNFAAGGFGGGKDAPVMVPTQN